MAMKMYEAYMDQDYYDYYPGSDNEWADKIMIRAGAIKCAPRQAREDFEDARDRAIRLRERATSPGAVRYNRERVQSSYIGDVSDTIITIDEAERDAWIANIIYMAESAALSLCCIAAGFNGYQAKIWQLYYAKGYSMGQIAQRMKATKSRVQYLLTSIQAEKKFCLGIDKIQNERDMIINNEGDFYND